MNVFRRFPVSLLHLSIALIAVAGVISWLSAIKGEIVIDNNSWQNNITLDNTDSKKLPFGVKLYDFAIRNYPGSDAPMDYVAKIVFSNDSTKIIPAAMNSVATCGNYRFFIKSYNEADNTLTLAVGNDPWGIAVVYSGYVIALFAMIMFFFNRHTTFRVLIKQLRTAATVCMLLMSVCASAAEALPKHLPESTAQEFCRLNVLFNGRICPLSTVARNFTIRLTGDDHVNGLSAEQVFTGWIFYYSSWRDVPMINIKGDEVKQLLGVNDDKVSLSQFLNSYGDYRLASIMNDIRNGKNVEGSKGFIDADEKFHIFSMLYSGELLKIFPIKDVNNNIVWYSQGDKLPLEADNDKWLYVKRSLDYACELAAKGNYAALEELSVKMRKYQYKEAAEVIPSDFRLSCELLLNRFFSTRLFAIMLCIIGLAAIIMTNSRYRKLIFFIACVALLYLSLMITLQWIIGGHIPLSNGYETLQFIGWTVLSFALFASGKYQPLLPFGIFLCGVAMLVAYLIERNPQITPLLPVLNSPLLSIHVALIMASYSLFALTMLNSVACLINRSSIAIKKAAIAGRVMIYPAVFLLAAGIIVGSIWANVSWGRYWGWDPKEVWALITMLIYSLPLHTTSLKLFKKPRFFHIFAIVAFLSVLITYFGVNYFSSGLHSYAG